jgi:hypothetical protein
MAMKRILFFSIIWIMIIPFGHAQNYSIKDRLNTRLSFSFNRTNNKEGFFQWDVISFRRRLNARAECNYGVLNWLELGGYLGFMRLNTNNGPEVAFAPTFGININVHLLPFWVRNTNCRWELYLTAKYGGSYLINYYPAPESIIAIRPISFGRNDTTYFYADANYNRYRHEFGIGIGGGVYFWNLFGVYAEAMVGQYSYFPELFSSNYSVRVGIEFKFKTESK